MTAQIDGLALMAIIFALCAGSYYAGWRAREASQRMTLAAADAELKAAKEVQAISATASAQALQQAVALDKVAAEAASLRAIVDKLDVNAGRRLENVEGTLGQLVIALGRGLGVNIGPRTTPGTQVGEKGPE